MFSVRKKQSLDRFLGQNRDAASTDMELVWYLQEVRIWTGGKKREEEERRLIVFEITKTEESFPEPKFTFQLGGSNPINNILSENITDFPPS